MSLCDCGQICAYRVLPSFFTLQRLVQCTTPLYHLRCGTTRLCTHVGWLISMPVRGGVMGQSLAVIWTALGTSLTEALREFAVWDQGLWRSIAWNLLSGTLWSGVFSDIWKLLV